MCGRQNFKMVPKIPGPWCTCASLNYSNINVCTAVREFCGCNLGPKSVDFKTKILSRWPDLII